MKFKVLNWLIAVLMVFWAFSTLSIRLIDVPFLWFSLAFIYTLIGFAAVREMSWIKYPLYFLLVCSTGLFILMWFNFSLKAALPTLVIISLLIVISIYAHKRYGLQIQRKFLKEFALYIIFLIGFIAALFVLSQLIEQEPRNLSGPIGIRK